MFGWGSASKGASTRGLYREILRAAQHWPSTRRAKVIEEIRLEFRQNSTEADAAKRDSLLEQARLGLSALKQQAGLSRGGSDISYQYETHKAS